MLNLHAFRFYGVVLPVLLFCSRPVDSGYLGLEVDEPEPAGQHLLHYPQDGTEVKINPPGFTWTAHERAANYRFLLFRGS